MKSLPYYFLGVASLFALAGMIFGMWMSASGDHTLAGAHAHNNLVGFVVMSIYGFFYRLVPSAADTTLARVHFWLALLSALTFGPGIAMAILGQGELLVQISAFAVLLTMGIFAYTVWSNRRGLTNA